MSGTHSEKHGNHEMKKKRVKKRVIQTNVQEKLPMQKNKRKHARERLKKSLEAITSPISTKKTTYKDNTLKEYADYISKVARTIAKARGMEVSEEHINKDIQDMMNFQIKLIDVSTLPHYFVRQCSEKNVQ